MIKKENKKEMEYQGDKFHMRMNFIELEGNFEV